MLLELSIQNFAIIDTLHLSFAPGLNVLTGETGAGKSIVIDAMGLLLGERAQSEFIRTGTDKAVVEGVFAVEERAHGDVRTVLEENGLLDSGEALDTIILTREIRTEGANICRINQRPVTLRLLQSIGDQLIDIHGQGEHLSLLKGRAQLELLDRYAETGSLRAEFAEQVRELRRVRRAIDALAMNERDKAQRIDRLTFVVEEISDAKLEPGEEEELKKERRRLANAEQIVLLSQQIHTLLYEGSEEQPAVVDVLGQVLKALRDLIKLDDAVASEQETVEQATYLLEDVARRIADYGEGTQYDPARLRGIERRLDLIFRLKRKYGDTVEEVIEAGEKAQQELVEMEGVEERVATLRHAEETLLRRIGQLGVELSEARRAAGERLASAVEQQLAELRMEHARFAVACEWTQDSEGVPVPSAFGNDPDARYAFNPTGLDRVTFMISTNPGEPLKPMAKIASGGETARLMLALKTVLGEADETPILIFDEIDTGIGGRVGAVVGRKLHGLSQRHQVFCVTHLPHLAAFGDAHYRLYKEFDGDRTVTRVVPLDEEGRLAELAQMLGTGESARETAVEMRQEVMALQ